jgi:catechol 2,3-dioxygenase-like lactoylglutathione lyase family enzyme
VFDHVEIHVSDLVVSRTFYGEALGLPTFDGELVEWGDFGIVAVDEEHPLTRNLHVAFGVEDRDAVDGWWNRMIEAGYASDGEPGPRPQYNESYYGAFVLDPEGNSVEAVHHYRSRTGEIDHLWLRTPDVEASRRFYVTIASSVGIELSRDLPELVRWSDG